MPVGSVLLWDTANFWKATFAQLGKECLKIGKYFYFHLERRQNFYLNGTSIIAFIKKKKNNQGLLEKMHVFVLEAE